MLRARFIPFPFRFNGFPSARPCSSSCAVRGRFTAAPASASRCVRRLTGLRTFAVANRYHRPLCHIGSMSKSAFHTSARRGDAPVLVLSFLFKVTMISPIISPFILIYQTLQTSYALTAATSITRVALTLLPLVLLQRLAITRFLRVPDPCATLAKRICDCLATASRRRFYLMKHRQLTRMAWALVFVPAVSLGLTLCASVETTPLTGRLVPDSVPVWMF